MSSGSPRPSKEKKASESQEKVRQVSVTTSQNVNKLGFHLLGGLFTGRDRCNLIFSPICLATQLACLVAGSEGDTKKQLEDALHIDLDGLQNIILKFKGEMVEHNFCAAQKVFLDSSIPMLDTFRHVIETKYMTSAQDVDFKDPAHAYVAEINEWSKRRTSGKITSVVSKRTVPSATGSMVLVSNVFFKGLWNYRFSLNSTQQMNFYLNSDDVMPVRMMVRTGRYAYAEFPKKSLRVLELPYRTSNVAMVILLPCEHDGLPALEQLLMKEPELVQEISRQLRPRGNVRLALPKFVSSVRSKLRSVLEGLGVKAAFSDTEALFTGISGYKGLCVTNLIHTAMIEITEDGNEPPLSTTLMTEVVSKMTPSTHFIVDRPFMFYIRSVATDAILFLGCIWKPDEWLLQSPDISVVSH
ncbi:ovalbumin-related protein X-like [Ornithodoros turicata]|uniref:ovalbumin-related protein X-like n=1 Tax=Ornithodoros turicata TaxID=34597 RepID=UPI003138CEEC